MKTRLPIFSLLTVLPAVSVTATGCKVDPEFTQPTFTSNHARAIHSMTAQVDATSWLAGFAVDEPTQRN